MKSNNAINGEVGSQESMAGGVRRQQLVKSVAGEVVKSKEFSGCQ